MAQVEFVDLRSDTVTQPTPAMRAAMAEARVGDDVYGEDPTVRELEETVANLLGKEAALFLPSGTMGNQIALLCQTRPGDEVVIGEGAHIAYYESGAGAALAGVQFSIAGAGGLFDRTAFAARVLPVADFLPRTSLVSLENTHNRAGGRVFPQADVIAVAAHARELGIGVHLDGSRLWHAAVVTSASVATLAAPADTVNVCFSKGLGAPVGSALCGTRELVGRARRFRKMLGGGMRQSGILAAGALHALEHGRGRLAEDHAAARTLGEILSAAGARLTPPETNLVVFELAELPAARVVAACRKLGVLLNATGPATLRAVTHRDVSASQVARAGELIATAIELVRSGG